MKRTIDATFGRLDVDIREAAVSVSGWELRLGPSGRLWGIEFTLKPQRHADGTIEFYLAGELRSEPCRAAPGSISLDSPRQGLVLGAALHALHDWLDAEPDLFARVAREDRAARRAALERQIADLAAGVERRRRTLAWHERELDTARYKLAALTAEEDGAIVVRAEEQKNETHLETRLWHSLQTPENLG